MRYMYIANKVFLLVKYVAGREQGYEKRCEESCVAERKEKCEERCGMGSEEGCEEGCEEGYATVGGKRAEEMVRRIDANEPQANM